MPKIIKDLKPQIKEEAIKMFEDIGYEAVTMRSLSSHVGIAVGTLYNYFPNKEVLYTEILYESWLATFNGIKEILYPPYTDIMIKKTIIKLYDDVVMRKGLGKYIFTIHQGKITGDIKLRELFESMFALIEKVMIDLEYAFPKRKAMMLLVDISKVIAMFPDEREENIAYLIHIIKETSHE